MRTGYKIKEVKQGFKVWELKDYGQGYAYDDTGRIFRSREEAEEYIRRRKEGEEK